ncbi:MAG: TetR/AcrR family transcriptional regulator [Flavobacteriaceae bacterium]
MTRERIIAAAAKVVARDGYQKTSISKIAAEARIASGSIYYYYANREELLSELLPTLGRDLIRYIQDRVSHLPWGSARELAGFDAYFDYLNEYPEFYRVFTEAQVYVPGAYERLLKWIVKNYIHNLEDQSKYGSLKVEKEDYETLAFMLAGIRNYASQMLNAAHGDREAALKRMRRIYAQFLVEGIFKEE